MYILVGEPNIVTAATLPTTTQRTRPTEPSTTTPFPVSFYIYMPQLGARESEPTKHLVMVF